MTAVGKILVFFNLLLSLAVGGLTVASYISRTYWVEGYQKMAQRAQVSDNAARTYQAENDRLVKEKQDLNDKLIRLAGKQADIKGGEDVDRVAQKVAKALDDAQGLVKGQKEEIDGLRGKMAGYEKKATQQEAVALAALKDVERRQADNEKLRVTVKDETDRNILLTKEKAELRDSKVAAEIQVTTLHDINKRLEDELQRMAKDLARKSSGVAGGSARSALNNPPPENVEGLVKRADPSTGLVTISLGSDAGIARGHTMEVFRFGPVPKYLGKIKILEVTNNQAVGQTQGRMSGPVQVGDRVASRIMGGN